MESAAGGLDREEERERTLGQLRENSQRYSFLIYNRRGRSCWADAETALRRQPEYIDSATRLMERGGELALLYKRNSDDPQVPESFLFAEVSSDCPGPMNICFDEEGEADLQEHMLAGSPEARQGFNGNARAIARGFGVGVRLMQRWEHSYIQSAFDRLEYRERPKVPERGPRWTSTWVDNPRPMYSSEREFGICTAGPFINQNRWTFKASLGARLILQVPDL